MYNCEAKRLACQKVETDQKLELLARSANYNPPWLSIAASQPGSSNGFSSSSLVNRPINGCSSCGWKVRWTYDDYSSVKAAVYFLGYKDATHLAHDFKTHFGISPNKTVVAGFQHRNSLKWRVLTAMTRFWATR